MATAASSETLRQIDRLFGAGTVTGLSDAQLLERFAATRDEAAFAALVQRHGPMVLATCRAILNDEHAAEDAFQATFLTLARKARSLWAQRTTLGGWLYRVAHRNAIAAGTAAGRRRVHETRRSDELTCPSLSPTERIPGPTGSRSCTRRSTACPSTSASRSCCVTSRS